MDDLQKTRKRFTLVLATLAFINLVLLVYLFWPGSSHAAQQAQEEELRQQHIDLSQQVALWHKSDPAKTREDLKRLYGDNVPTRWSQISQQVEKLMHETGVTEQSIVYPVDTTEKSVLPDVQRVKIDTVVTGDYEKVARFINALEQDKLLFIIEKISLTGKEGGAVVSLQIAFDTFVKEPAWPGSPELQHKDPKR